MNVLITGGTGLIGQHLTKLLIKKGYQVSYLSRKKENIESVKVFQWDLEKGYIDPDALTNVDYILHLAGAGIADKRWTKSRKQEIVDSRVKPILLLNQHLQKKNTKIRAFISSSGINYYGSDTGETLLDENSPRGDSFLADCTVLWETETRRFTQAQRTVSIRTGMVLSAAGGALPKMALPVKLGIGSPLGNGRQWVSWIHIDDICHLYLQSIEDEKMKGTYNAVAPNPVRNEELTKTAAEILKKPVWLPNVPAFILKLIFGELALAILGGNFVKNKRLAEELAFRYKFSNLKDALENLLK